jgi:hypothetical protein
MRASLARLDAVLASPISGLTYEAIGKQSHVEADEPVCLPPPASRIDRHRESLWIVAFLVSAVRYIRGYQ